MPVIIKTDMPEGNAWGVMGAVEKILKLIHGSEEAAPMIEEYQQQATSGDYENLKKVSLQFVNKNCADYPLLIFTTSDNVSEQIIDDDKVEPNWWDDDDDDEECEECGWLLEDCEC